MGWGKNIDMGRLSNLILYAVANIDQYYSRKAMMLLSGINTNSYIIVSKFNHNKLRFCGLACSIGLGGFGIVFMDREVLGDPDVPEELKDFILVHELAHIVRNHVISKVFIKFLEETFIQALGESIKSLEGTKDIIDKIFNLISTTFLYSVTLKLVDEIDPQVVKQQELEADWIAIELTGCRGALVFAEILKQLKLQGYDVSHESIFGFPALTIDERIRFIYQKCQ